MIFYDCSHTSHCAANTGIQHTSRCLFKALSINQESNVVPICFDPYQNTWRNLDCLEKSLMTENKNFNRKKNRSSFWTLKQCIRGIFFRFLNSKSIISSITADALIISEIFKPEIFKALKKIYPNILGPKIAIFYDTIALKFPEYTPNKTVNRFPEYLNELITFDGIAAISEDSKISLLEYWLKHYPKTVYPKIKTISLASNTVSKQSIMVNQKINSCIIPKILFVSTIEGRKNHKNLLDAAKQLWDSGLNFKLELIGLLNKETGQIVLNYLNNLQNQGYPVKWLGPVDEKKLQQSYQGCYFTIYPSLYEGFGLPVLEGLSYGKPCVLTPGGALKEIAKEGGCLVTKDFSSFSIAKSIKKLILEPKLYNKLKKEALYRSTRTWNDYAEELLKFIEELR